MFENKPETLPCGQHDKYKEIRQATGKMLRKHPLMLLGMLPLGKTSVMMTKERILFDDARYPMNSTTINRKETT
jgi:hypothetical protein